MKWNQNKSIVFSQIALAVFALILLALDIFMNPIIDWYLALRHAENQTLKIAMMIVLYVNSVFGWIFLWAMNRLLLNIKKEEVFVEANVKLMRIISWCLLIVGIIFAVGCFFYPIFFLCAAAAAFMSLIVRIVKNAFQQAISMKSELDLTV